MAIYLLLFASVPFWYLIFRKHKKIYVSIIALELFALLAIRSPMLGVDMPNYVGGYEYISKLSFKEMISSLELVFPARLNHLYAYESGYVVLNWVLFFVGLVFLKGFTTADEIPFKPPSKK